MASADEFLDLDEAPASKLSADSFLDEGPEEPIGTLEDVVKSSATGLERAAAGTAMILPNLMNQAVAGPQMLYRGIRDTFQGSPVDNSPLFQPFFSSEDLLQGRTPVPIPEMLRPHESQTTAGEVAGGLSELFGGLAVPKALTPRSQTALPPKLPANRVDMKQLASEAYDTATKAGGILKGDFTDKFLDEIDILRPQSVSGKLLAEGDELDKFGNALASKRGKAMTLAEAQDIDEALGQRISSRFGINGLDKEGYRLQELQKKFRNMIEDVSDTDVIGGKEGFDALKSGRDLWARQSRMRDIERIMERAESSENPVGVIKRGFSNLYNNTKKSRGFTEEEKRLIKKASKSGVATDVMQLLGNRMVGGTAGAISGTLGGGLLGGLGGATAGAIVGAPMRAAANAMQRSRGNSVLKEITNRGNKMSSAEELARGLTNEGGSGPIRGAAATAITPANRLVEKPVISAAPEEREPAEEVEQQSEIPLSFISEEGNKTKAYTDTTGNRTVGAGFNMDSGIARQVWKDAGIKKDFNKVRNGKEKITDAESQKLLQASYKIATDDIRSLIPNFDDLGKNQQEALTHLAYQYGKPRLKEALPGVLTMAKTGNTKGAAARLLASDYGRKYKKRAMKLATMLYNDSPYQTN